MGVLSRQLAVLTAVALCTGACSLLLDFDALQRRDPAMAPRDAAVTPPAANAPDASTADACDAADAAVCTPDAG